MKQKITFLVFMFLVSLFAFGQRAELKNKRNLKKHGIENQFKESNQDIYKFRFGNLFLKNKNASKDSNIKSSQLAIKQRLDSLIQQDWDDNNSQWYNYLKDEFTYDAKNNIEQEIEYEWDLAKSVWEKEYKYDFTYDSYGNLMEEICYEWYPSNANWDLIWKDEYVYDTNGNIIQYLEFGSSNEFKEHDFTYDTNGYMTQELVYEWNQDPSEKIEFTYDSSGNIIQHLYYEWETNQWVVLVKGEYTYDANGNWIQGILSGWDEDSDQWVQDWKDEYNYDSNGNMIQYFGNWWGGQWNNYWKVEYNFDNSYSVSDLILPNYYYSDYSMSVLLTHMLTGALGYNWDPAMEDWVEDSISSLYYSQQNSLSVSEMDDTKINIYPNPVSNVLTVDSRSPLTKIEIFSILGQKEKEIISGFNAIQLNSLLSGFYIIKIYSEKGTTVRKLIKQ